MMLIQHFLCPLVDIHVQRTYYIVNVNIFPPLLQVMVMGSIKQRWVLTDCHGDDYLTLQLLCSINSLCCVIKNGLELVCSYCKTISDNSLQILQTKEICHNFFFF